MPSYSYKPRRPWGAAFALSCFLAITTHLLWFLPAAAQSGITSPGAGASVSGDVAILGTAVIDPFQKYELHYKLEPSGDDAFIYFFGGTTPVINGQLGTWQAAGLPPGVYSLRLRVVKNDGNYAEFFTPNLSVNQGGAASNTPEPTPTSSEPTPTPIPTATFTPAPQPTPVVGQVAQPALDIPTPTPTAEAVALVNPQNGSGTTDALNTTNLGATDATVDATGGSVSRELGEALSLNRLRDQFLNGMRMSAALALGVVALYGGKRLFDWVWTQYS
jgi:hypothetical protein